jgi:hypothetical protein
MGHAGRGYDRVSAEFDITRQGVAGVEPAALGRPATTFCMHNSGDQRQMAPSYSHISDSPRLVSCANCAARVNKCATTKETPFHLHNSPLKIVPGDQMTTDQPVPRIP